MSKIIAVLAGDGVGPEVMTQALRVLEIVDQKHNLGLEFTEALVGGAAYDQHQEHLPASTLETCRNANAILFGSVGGPITDQQNAKWKNCEANALLGLRKTFNFNANFRPAKVYSQLAELCPLKSEIISGGVDLLILRELLGDLYFGERSFYEENGEEAALDTCTYTTAQIRSIVQQGFLAAQKRTKRLVSVDKANVLNTSKLWRKIVEEEAPNYPDVKWEHMLVDNCAMQLVKNPGQFDVIVTSNMFGDILSDVAAMLPGSLGLTPSASINEKGFGMYEPSGGSAQDIAGKNIANPCAQILSASMMLRFSFNEQEAADQIDEAVEKCFADGHLTADLSNNSPLGTKEFTDQIIKNLA